MTNNHYQKSREKRSKKTCERYQILSEDEKDKKWQYAHEQYRNLSEKKKEVSICDCNWTRTQNNLVLKQTLNHLAQLAK